MKITYFLTLLPLLLSFLSCSTETIETSGSTPAKTELFSYWKLVDLSSNEKNIKSLIIEFNETENKVYKHIKCENADKSITFEQTIGSSAKFFSDKIEIVNEVSTKDNTLCSAQLKKETLYYDFENRYLILKNDPSDKSYTLLEKAYLYRNSCLKNNWNDLGNICIDFYNTFEASDQCSEILTTKCRPTYEDSIEHFCQSQPTDDARTFLFKGFYGCKQLYNSGEAREALTDLYKRYKHL